MKQQDRQHRQNKNFECIPDICEKWSVFKKEGVVVRSGKGGSDNISLEEKRTVCKRGWMGDVHEWKRVRESGKSVEECRTVSVLLSSRLSKKKAPEFFLLANGYFCFSRFLCLLNFISLEL